jgi:hypothetical protein
VEREEIRQVGGGACLGNIQCASGDTEVVFDEPDDAAACKNSRLDPAENRTPDNLDSEPIHLQYYMQYNPDFDAI